MQVSWQVLYPNLDVARRFRRYREPKIIELISKYIKNAKKKKRPRNQHPNDATGVICKAPTVHYTLHYIYGKYPICICICIHQILILPYTVNISYIVFVYGLYMVQLNRTSALSKSDSWVVSMVSFDIFCAPALSSVNVNPRNLFNNQVEKKVIFRISLYSSFSDVSST